MNPHDAGQAPEPVVMPDAPTPVPAAAPMSRWKKARLVVKVVELRLRFIVLLAGTGLVFAYWDTLWNRYDKWMRPQAEAGPVAVGVEYYCPMHPQVVRDAPGSCPICGMPLARREKGSRSALPAGLLARVQLAPVRVEQAGIATVPVDYAPLEETLTTVGYVDHDERRVVEIACKIPGKSRVEKLYVNYEGISIHGGQPLAELYSPELYQASKELLINARRAAGAAARKNAGPAGDQQNYPTELLERTTAKLKLWGITQEQIDKILRTGQADYRVPVYATLGDRPIHVIKKNVIEGQYVEEGQSLFVVADLSQVWIRAKVYENDLALVRTGQEVEASVAAYPGEVFKGQVEFMFPHLDATTRTIEVWYAIPNPEHRLRPGMYATVRLKSLVADTPMYQNVVKRAPAQAEGGARLASMTAAEQKICPVTSARLGSMGEPVPIEVQGRKVWTCCAACPPKVRAEPAKYLARLVQTPPVDGVLSVPESAVIDTGALKMVFVETAPGVYEGRKVVLGVRTGNRYPVLEGLERGEKVVAAGAFLVDAESRLEPGARGPALKGQGPQSLPPHQHQAPASSEPKRAGRRES